MNYLYVVCFMCIWLNYVLCLPAHSKNSVSFYDVIAEKCPSVHSDAAYKNDRIFRVCKDWKTISEVNQLTGSNAKEIRCLFYYNSFTEYCSKSPKINTTVPNDALSSYNYHADMICDYAKNVSHTKLKAIFSTGNNCKLICADDLEDNIDSICGMAYYFAHNTVKPQLPASSRPSEASGTQKNNDTAQNSQVPSSENVQPSGDGQLLATPEKSGPSKVKNTVVETPDTQIKPEQGRLNSNVATNNNEQQQKNQQNNNPDESNVNPSHNLDLAANAARTVPKFAKNSSGDANVVHEKAAIVPVVPQTQQQQQKPAPSENQDATVNNDGEKIEGSSVDRPVEPTMEKSDDSNVKNVKPVIQSTEGNGKPQEKPANSPGVVETDNQDISQDLEEEKQTAEIQQMANQDSEMDGDIQLQEGQDGENVEPPISPLVHKEKDSKPLRTDETEPGNYNTEMDGDSYFFTYFMLLCIIFIVGYVCYHNKQKILALILEGRKGRRQYRGRRPNSANYHKLDSNLEEAITSSCEKNTNNVIY